MVVAHNPVEKLSIRTRSVYPSRDRERMLWIIIQTYFCLIIAKMNNLRKINISYLDTFKGEIYLVLGIDTKNLQVEEIIFHDVDFLWYNDTFYYFPSQKKWIVSHHHNVLYEVKQPT